MSVRRRSLLSPGLVVALARQPRLWPTAWRQARRLAPQRWWARPPFLPLPEPEYLEFRLLTQYGKSDGPVVPQDVLNYLSWSRDWQRRSS